ncbi:hypothetical protein AB1Y20_004125 [Prymnesium parvum]|uniref:HAT C-terminal dimerisation domain-containing protein n=1 Tax=Prymnesium parvum TaxID=97485 RepID=A0AB34J8I7_PRYPA
MARRLIWRPRTLPAAANPLPGHSASQKALKAWSDAQAPENKLRQIDGKYTDMVQHFLRLPSFKDEIQKFVDATKSAVFLLRLVDNFTPVLGKFYYGCALVDKHLRVIEEAGSLSYIGQLRSIFAKRWKRWHRPVHTLAYALDPCYKEHKLTDHELKECHQVIRQVGGPEWPSIKIEFNRWRREGADTLFPEKVWEVADKSHGYEWWDSFGLDQFERLPLLASKILSKAVSASACEFNWSDVGQVITKKANRWNDSTINKLVNVRAMHRLKEKFSDQKPMMKKIPTIDDMLDEFVNEVVDSLGCTGDDVDDADEMNENEESISDDDEQYNLLDDDEEEMGEASGAGITVNESLLREL